MVRKMMRVSLSLFLCNIAFTSTYVFAEDIGPKYTKDGDVVRPTDWRDWIFVGTALTPNILNSGKASFPEYHNVYIEPRAFDNYEKTGKFVDGTQLVKVRTALYQGKDCTSRSSVNGSCQAVSGRGYFQGEYTGFELTVKDTKRFPDEPGGWVYYKFGEKLPWNKTAKQFPSYACNSCHASQAEGDFVFTQFYPKLRKDNKK